MSLLLLPLPSPSLSLSSEIKVRLTHYPHSHIATLREPHALPSQPVRLAQPRPAAQAQASHAASSPPTLPLAPRWRLAGGVRAARAGGGRAHVCGIVISGWLVPSALQKCQCVRSIFSFPHARCMILVRISDSLDGLHNSRTNGAVRGAVFKTTVATPKPVPLRVHASYMAGDSLSLAY